jgi:hypothetical protein
MLLIDLSGVVKVKKPSRRKVPVLACLDKICVTVSPTAERGNTVDKMFNLKTRVLDQLSGDGTIA